MVFYLHLIFCSGYFLRCCYNHMGHQYFGYDADDDIIIITIMVIVHIMVPYHHFMCVLFMLSLSSVTKKREESKQGISLQCKEKTCSPPGTHVEVHITAFIPDI